MVESSTPAPSPSRRRRRRWPWYTLLPLVAVLLTHRWWLPPTLELGGPYLARALADLDLEIDDVRTASPWHVEVRGLRLRDRETAGAALDLTADHLEVQLAPLALLRGEVSGVRAVRGDSVRLLLDLGASPPAISSTDSSPTLDLPIHLPIVELTRCALDLRLPDRTRLDADQISLRCDADDLLQLTTPRVDFVPSHTLDTGVLVPQTRSITLVASWRHPRVEAIDLDVDERPILADSSVDLSELAAGVVAVDLSLATTSPPSTVRARLDSERLGWQADLVGLDLGKLTALVPAVPSLGGRVELHTEGALAWDSPTLAEGELDLTVSDFAGFDRQATSLTCRASTHSGTLVVTSLALAQPGNELSLGDATVPLADLSPFALLRTASGELSAAITDLSALTGRLELPEASSNLPEHRLVLDAHLADGLLRLRSGSLESAGGRFDLDRGSLHLPTDPDQPVSIELESRADFAHLDQLGLLFGRSDWSGSLRGRVSIEGSWPDFDGTLLLGGERVSFGEIELGELSIDLVADREAIVARELKATSGELRLLGHGTYRHESAALHDAHLSLAVERLQTWLGDDRFAGSLTAEVDAEGPLTEPELRASATAAGLRFADVDVTDAALRLTGTGRSLRVEDLHVETTLGRLFAIGSVVLGEAGLSASITLERLELEQGRRALALAAPCAIRVDQSGGCEVDALRLAGGIGHVELTAEWTRDDLCLETRGELGELLLPDIGTPLVVSWQLDQRDGRLELASLEIEGEELHFAASGSLPIEPLAAQPLTDGDLTLTFDSRLPLALLAGERAGGTALLGGRIGGRWSDLEGTLRLEGRALRFLSEEATADLADGHVVGEIRLDSGLVVDELLIRLGDLVTARAAGRVSTELDLLRWVDDPAGTARSAQVSGKLDVESIDITRLEPLLAALGETTEQLRGGELGGNLALEGPLLSPELRGEVVLRDGLVRLGSGLPTADRLDAHLRLDGQRLEIVSLTGDLGGAPFELTGGAELKGAEPTLDFRLEGKDLLLFRSREGKVRADTSVHLAGPLSALVAKGSVALTDGRYAPTTEFLDFRRGSSARGARGFQLFRWREPPLRDLALDIALTARAPLRITNTVIQGSVRPDLHLSGNGLVPVLTGTVFLEHSTMKLPSGQLELTGGTVIFRPEDPFLPKVDVLGRTRMLGYTISATISGPYDSPEILLTSTPALPQESLLLLLLTGRLPDDPDQTDPLATANTVALYLATDTLARWFTDEGPMNEDSLPNRFELVTGREVSRNGVESIEVAFRLTSKEDLPDDERNRRHLYLAAERDEYEYYNYGLRLVFRLR